MTIRRGLMLAIALAWTLTASGLERQAFTFTNYTLKVKVDPARQGILVEGTLQARNDSSTPQKNIVLQISSTLQWTAVRVGDQEVPWLQQPYTSDIDHTGQLTEAILTLPKPVAPGSTITLNIAYEGTIPLNTGRLLRMNTPGTYAARTDWDRISENFTAVRGLGYVVWYPVALEAASLSDGSAIWDALEEWNNRHRVSSFKAVFTIPAGTSLVSNADSQTVTAAGTEISYSSVGTHAPTFVIGPFQMTDRPGLTVYHLPNDTQTARDYIVAAEKITPQIAEWFGKPRSKLVIVQLPDQEVLPYDDGSRFFFAPLNKIQQEGIELALAHQLVHTIIESRRPWIQEGLGYLAQLITRERQAGRDQTLIYLHQFNAPLANTEKSALESGKPQPLATSNDQLIYRAKAAFVWYMLRDLAGDAQLSSAIRKYQSQADTQPAYVQSLVEAELTPKRSLENFFDDWVYRDKGLADLKIETVYPRATLGENYVVTVTVENLGEAGASAVVIVQSKKGERSEHTWVPGKSKAVIRVSFPGVPEKVYVNDGSVPEWNSNNNEYEIKNLPATPR